MDINIVVPADYKADINEFDVMRQDIAKRLSEYGSLEKMAFDHFHRQSGLAVIASAKLLNVIFIA